MNVAELVGIAEYREADPDDVDTAPNRFAVAVVTDEEFGRLIQELAGIRDASAAGTGSAAA